MDNKKIVRLTESQLRNIITESVNQILKEYGETEKGQYMLGRLARRQADRMGHHSPTVTPAWKHAENRMPDRNNPRKGEAESDWWKRRGALEYGANDDKRGEMQKRVNDYMNGAYDTDYEKEHDVWNGNSWTKVNKGKY